MISTGGSFLSVWRMVPFITTILPKFAERRKPPLCEPTHVEKVQLQNLVEGFRPTEAVLQSLAMCRVDAVRHLGRVQCHALGVVGDATKTGVRLMQRAMSSIPNSRLEVVRDSFDPTNLCQPGEFNRLLAGFLSEIGW